MYSDPSGYSADLNEAVVSQQGMAIVDAGLQSSDAMCLAVFRTMLVSIGATTATIALTYAVTDFVLSHINEITAGYIISSEIADLLISHKLDISIIFNKTYNPDPYARPDQKKQGRENKEDKKKKDDWTPRNNKRDNKPSKPKSHTPGREHRKY